MTGNGDFGVMVLCARATFDDGTPITHAPEKGRASAIGSTRPHRPFGRHRAARPHRSLLNFGSKSTPCALLLVKTIRVRLGTYRSPACSHDAQTKTRVVQDDYLVATDIARALNVPKS